MWHFRLGTRLVALTATVLTCVAGAYGAVRPGVDESFLSRAGIVSLALAAIWIFWRFAWHPGVLVDHQGVLIVNPIWRWTLPYGAINRVESREGLEVVLTDGRDVPVFAFSKSWLAELSRDKASLKAKRGIETKINHDVEGTPSRRLEWSWVDLALLAPFAVSAVLVGLGFNE